MSEELGCIEGKNGHRADPSLPGLEEGISCACGCLMYCVGSSADTGLVKENGSPYSICK
jgi:hypothetical protein